MFWAASFFVKSTNPTLEQVQSVNIKSFRIGNENLTEIYKGLLNNSTWQGKCVFLFFKNRVMIVL